MQIKGFYEWLIKESGLEIQISELFFYSRRIWSRLAFEGYQFIIEFRSQNFKLFISRFSSLKNNELGDVPADVEERLRLKLASKIRDMNWILQIPEV